MREACHTPVDLTVPAVHVPGRWPSLHQVRRGITEEQRQAYAEGLLLMQQLVESVPAPVGHRAFRVFTLIEPEPDQKHAAA
jgi:hypothetical protein